MKIYKYVLTGGPGSTLITSIPGKAKPLSVGLQQHTPVMWFVINENNRPNQDWLLTAVFTGQDVPTEFMSEDFVGTVMDDDLGLVYHLLAKQYMRPLATR